MLNNKIYIRKLWHFCIIVVKSNSCYVIPRVFLAEQLKLLQKPLESLIPPAKKSFLQQFYAYTVSMAAELRYPIYLAVASCAIDYEQTLNMMINVKWDVTDIMSQHSSYVDSILRVRCRVKQLLLHYSL